MQPVSLPITPAPTLPRVVTRYRGHPLTRGEWNSLLEAHRAAGDAARAVEPADAPKPA